MPIDATAITYDYSLATCTLRIASVHTVTSGVADFSLPTSTIVEYAHGAPDATGAQVLATVESATCTSGVPRNAAVIGEFGLGRIAYLGLPYLANAVTYTNGDLRSGSADRLLEQAVAWVSGLTD